MLTRLHCGILVALTASVTALSAGCDEATTTGTGGSSSSSSSGSAGEGGTAGVGGMGGTAGTGGGGGTAGAGGAEVVLTPKYAPAGQRAGRVDLRDDRIKTGPAIIRSVAAPVTKTAAATPAAKVPAKAKAKAKARRS